MKTAGFVGMVLGLLTFSGAAFASGPFSMDPKVPVWQLPVLQYPLMLLPQTPSGMGRVKRGLVFAGYPSGQVGYANPIVTVINDLGMNGMASPTGAMSAPQTTLQPSAMQIAVAKVVDQYSAEIMKLPGVWEVGDHAEDDGTVTIRVMADAITPELISAIPPVLGGFPVVLGEGPRPIELGSASSCPVVAKPALKKDDSQTHPLIPLRRPN